MANVNGTKTIVDLVAMMAHDLRMQGDALNQATQNIRSLAEQNEALARGYMAMAQQLERAEHFLYALIRVSIQRGLDYKDIQASIEEYPKHTDLLVYFGVRTQEEYDALSAASKKGQVSIATPEEIAAQSDKIVNPAG